MAAVAYVHPRKARPEPIAGTTDFEMMIGMGEVGAGAPGSEDWSGLTQPSFRCLWNKDFKEKGAPHFPHEDSMPTKLASTSSNPSLEY